MFYFWAPSVQQLGHKCLSLGYLKKLQKVFLLFQNLIKFLFGYTFYYSYIGLLPCQVWLKSVTYCGIYEQKFNLCSVIGEMTLDLS